MIGIPAAELDNHPEGTEDIQFPESATTAGRRYERGKIEAPGDGLSVHQRTGNPE